MPSFDEGRQRFTFDDRWIVVKYDDHPDYRLKIARLDGTKAVDLVGLCGGADGILYWIEVKDFRGYRIENKSRLSNGDLAQEIAKKVRDSLAGVVGAYGASSNPDEWKPFVRSLWRKASPMRVLLWLEEDGPRRPRGIEENAANVLSDEIKKKLRWLAARVLVVSQDVGRCPEGLVVADLPGAGRTTVMQSTAPCETQRRASPTATRHASRSIRAGSSTRSLTRVRNSTASRPSTRRWS